MGAPTLQADPQSINYWPLQHDCGNERLQEFHCNNKAIQVKFYQGDADCVHTSIVSDTAPAFDAIKSIIGSNYIILITNYIIVTQELFKHK